MAFEEYDDFEQEKLVKDWIKNNWFTITLGIVLGLGSVFGFNFYKGHQQKQRFEIANQYKSYTDQMELSHFKEARSILAKMQTDTGTSFYIIEGHLLLAKEFVNKNELEKAATELKSVIDMKSDQLMTEFVKLRLARVYNAMAMHDDALSLTNSITIESFLSIAKEIEGDALVAKGEYEKAVSAFENAVEKGEGYSGKRNIEMKIENS